MLENAQSDILLLLDTCALADPAVSGSHGVKQTIAARSPDQDPHAVPARSFTSCLTDSLLRLASGRAFSVQRLHEEVLSQHQRQFPPAPTTNGASVQASKPPRPIFFTVTPGKGQSLALSRLSGKPTNGVDTSSAPNGREELAISREDAAGVRLDESRILVCTTFVGEASPDMSFFHQWLQNTPMLGSRIAVEGIFLGPPTMLLISMPHAIWNVVQHDKVCCFLGYISSHNMLHLYEKLVGPSVVRPSTMEAEDGKILLEAREPATTPARPRDHEARDRPPSAHAPASLPAPVSSSAPLPVPAHATAPPPAPASVPREPERIKFTPHNSPKRRLPPISPNTPAIKSKDENDGPEGTEEMREAAEQLKALSHVRHRSDEAIRRDRPRTSLPNGMSDTRRTELPSRDPDVSDGDTPNRMKVPRRALPKNETRCVLCTHAPFRDSSSLRKHIAAAHTRPFPCAFSFAGCTSTFGSKNEWKRHITSQHLCLQYYRCSSCPRSAVEGKGNEFNRKDLFTQHLRRMHAPFQIKRPASKGDAKIQAEWEMHVRSMQQSCLISRRYPPQKSACPNPECRSVFEGVGSWDEWTEHVGRHMEKGEGASMGVDHHLIDWALDEGIIESKGGGTYRLTSTTHGNSHNHSISGGSSGSNGSRENGTTSNPDPSPSHSTGPNEPNESNEHIEHIERIEHNETNEPNSSFEENTIVVSKVPRRLSEPTPTQSEPVPAKEPDSVSVGGEAMDVDK